MDLDLDRTDFENTGKWVRTDHWYDNQRIIGTIIFSYVKLILNEIHGKFSSSVRRARETEIRFFFPIRYDIIIRLEFIIVLGKQKLKKERKRLRFRVRTQIVSPVTVGITQTVLSLYLVIYL